jgi:hypothetical protein
MRDIFDGAVISLECLGSISVQEHRFLDGVTTAHQVKLSPSIDGGFTGAHWHCQTNSDGNITFASAGGLFGFRYIDGRTQDGFVQLVGDTLPPFSGTAWHVSEISPGIVTIMSRGGFVNPDHQFLDGRTLDGSVGLAPSADSRFSGTQWRTTLLAKPSFTAVTKRDWTPQGSNTSHLDMRGSGFTPNDVVKFVAEGIVGRQDHAPFPLSGSTTVSQDGTFEAFADFGRFPTHPADVLVTIRVFDGHGITAADTSNGFHV